MNEVVVVNINDEVIGTMPRELAHKNGTPHRIAVIYLENDSGEILVQVRKGGRLDHSAAGHLDPGETYVEGAKRELKEELGIDGTDLKEIGSGKSVDLNLLKNINCIHIFKVFLAKANPKELQKEEVTEVYWKKPLEVLDEMNKDTEDRFTGGFKSSLQVYLSYLNK
jgi:isopentenyl-diphosphate delta-isomerase